MRSLKCAITILGVVTYLGFTIEPASAESEEAQYTAVYSSEWPDANGAYTWGNTASHRWVGWKLWGKTAGAENIEVTDIRLPIAATTNTAAGAVNFKIRIWLATAEYYGEDTQYDDPCTPADSEAQLIYSQESLLIVSTSTTAGLDYTDENLLFSFDTPINMDFTKYTYCIDIERLLSSVNDNLYWGRGPNIEGYSSDYYYMGSGVWGKSNSEVVLELYGFNHDQVCNITATGIMGDVSRAICNTFAFLFIPSENFTDALTDTISDASSTVPFGYWSQISEGWESVTGTESTTSSKIYWTAFDGSATHTVAIFDVQEVINTIPPSLLVDIRFYTSIAMYTLFGIWVFGLATGTKHEDDEEI